MSDDQILEKAVEELQAILDGDDFEAKYIAASIDNLSALCRTVKQLREQDEWQKSSIEQLTAGVTGCAQRLAAVTQGRDDLQSQLEQLRTQIERGALCEKCDQWEYNEDGSCRTFMVCGVCWNAQHAELEQLRAESEHLKIFVSMISRMTKDGEGGFEANALDSFETVESLITRARELEKL